MIILAWMESIDEIIRMLASYGGFLNRKGDGFGCGSSRTTQGVEETMG